MLSKIQGEERALVSLGVAGAEKGYVYEQHRPTYHIHLQRRKAVCLRRHVAHLAHYC